jgi:chromosome partitioning protein
MTSVSLGVSLARHGKKVLIIDADSQHSATISLGIAEPDKLPITLTTVMQSLIMERVIDPMDGLITHDEGVSLLASNNGLAGIEISLAPIIGREAVLRQYIDTIRDMFDYILIDTAPTLGLLTINALAAANSVIIPVASKFLDAKGLEMLLNSIAQTRRHINPHLSISGILFTMVDKRANITKDIISMIEQAYGDNICIFKEAIPHSVRAVETSATGKSIFKFDPNGKIAKAYTSLAGEVLEIA